MEGITKPRAGLLLVLLAICTSAIAQTTFVTPGPNTNVVGVTPNIANIPDFGLKQQQEPSCIVRPGNESYIFCAFNDLRASDLPSIQGDSWMGVAMSNDAGETWFSRLSPGYLGDTNNSINQGFAADPGVAAIPGNSPGLAILSYIAGFRGSDDGVLAIQRWVEFPQEDQDFWKPEDGIVIAADGSEGRFIDKPAFYYMIDSLGQQGTITEQISIEGESTPITVTTPTGTLIVAYAVFTGNGNGSKVYVRKSFDNGKTWTNGQKISEEQNEVTGVSITAIGQKFVVIYRRKGDNNDADAILSSFCSNDGNQKCTKGQVMFEMCPFDQPASGATHRTFSFPWAANDGSRYWAFAADRRFADDNSCAPISGSPGLFSGKPRIVGMSSKDGKNWVGASGNTSEPFVLAARPEGFQVMPVAFGTKGRIDIAWYDTFREEEVGLPSGPNDVLINDYVTGPARVFRKADVYMTRLTASCGGGPNSGCTPSIESPVRVSQYPVAIDLDDNTLRQEYQAHLPNLRLYASGTLAFNGDYISLATPPFRRIANGQWIPNSLPGGAEGPELPGFTDRQDLFVAWGDNRDVVADHPDPGGTGQLLYTPPFNADPGGPAASLNSVDSETSAKGSAQLLAEDEPDDDPNQPSDLAVCTPGGLPSAGNGGFDFSRSRDSNIYSSLVRDVPSLVAPTPTKPLGTIQRMFPLEITSIDPDNAQPFCLHVVNQPSDFPGNGLASFYQLPSVAPFADGDQLELLDVEVPAGSSASRAVFVSTGVGTTVINVNAYQGSCPATTAGPFGTLVNSVQLSDGPLFDPLFCDANPGQCDPVNINETHDITLVSPGLQAPVLQAPSFQAPSFQAPVLQAPVLQAPSFQAPSFQAPSLQAPVLQAPSFQAPSFQAPSFQAPVLQAPSLQAPSLQAGTIIGDADPADIVYQDVTYVVSTDANVTTTYSSDIGFFGLDSDETAVQLIAWTPNIYTASDGCEAVPAANQQVISYKQLDAPSLQAISLPTTLTPENQDPYAGEISFTGSPDKDIAVTVRIWAAGNAKQSLMQIDQELRDCIADEACDPEEENLGVQQLVAFGASAHSCSTADAENNTTQVLPDCLNNGNEKIFQDKLPPVFSIEPDITIEVEADLPDGAVVDLTGTGAVTASDMGEPVGVICYEIDSNGNIIGVLPDLLDIGSYPIRCEAVDDAGNVGSVELTVDVTDSIDPVITLLGDTTPVVEAGDPYVDPGSTATDIRGTTVINLVAVVTGSVDTFTPGVYTLTYTVTDTGGNTVVATRTITVEDNTPPDLSGVPGNISGVEATGPGGTQVTWPAPVATDIVDGSVAVICSPMSGSTFPIASTPVSCTATDSSGNTASGSFTVTVVDTQPPAVSINPDILNIQATSGAGAVVAWTNPAAVDVADGPLATSCSPTSGSVFGIGAHVVTCSATDAAGNTGSSVFSVTVVDSVAPIVDTLPDQVLEATGPAGAIATWTNPAANDVVDGSLASTCVPSSGSTFALGGPHVVTCSATDSNGNSGSSTFNVTIEDTTAPIVTANDISVPVFTADVDVTINYVEDVTAVDSVEGDLTSGLTCSIVAGPAGFIDDFTEISVAQYGTWTANCSVSDSTGNTGDVDFNITVEFPYDIDLQLPKKPAKAGSTIPIDWQYFDGGVLIDSGFIAPNVTWFGPFESSDTDCDVTADMIVLGDDAGSSDKRYSASSMTWQFSWKTPDLPGDNVLLVISPPGATDPAATACVRLK